MQTVQELNAYLVLKKQGKLLLLKRFNGIWEFPGGGVEFGEHPKDAAIRETKEETGLEAKEAELIGITSATFISNAKNKHAIYAVYLAKEFSGSVRISQEHAGFKWCSLKEAKRLELGLNVKPVLEMI